MGFPFFYGSQISLDPTAKPSRLHTIPTVGAGLARDEAITFNIYVG